EVPVFCVERNGKEAARAPLEAALLAVGELELRAARAFEHVVDVLVKVALRRGRAAGQDVDHEHVGEVAAALEVHGGALDAVAVARPRPRQHNVKVDAEVLGDEQPLALDPIEIGVDAVAKLLLRVHVRSSFSPLHRHRPRKRTIQYSRALAFVPYWMPAFAG